MILDLDKLSVSDPSLYAAVSITLGPARGQLQVALADFPLPTRRRLSDWWVIQKQKQSLAPDIAAAPPAPVETAPQEPLLSEQELLQRATDQTRGLARLQQFVDEQGLEDSPQTASLVDVWLTERNLFWSAANVDKAVLSLKNVLRWKQKVEPLPPAPAEPTTEALENWQLPIDADEYAMKKASVKALLDLNHRRRQASGQMILGKNGQANRVGTNL